ncbi:AMIN domain-containing protein [Candidatus Electrothrix marina]|uniref:AMIN domain-containing protein n=2 Tax=Candidatus Electrothrix marina TaxID=1859130 RepID=A0A444JH63_9BACT|nr:AMIN domain-containing protein [Candidatus Electrothrix marina]
MPHFFSTNQQQGRRNRSCCFIYCVMLFILLSVSMPALAAEESPSHEQILINGLSAAPVGKNLEISAHCSGKADYIPIELTKPSKIVIDIADAAIASGAELVLSPESYGVGVASKLIRDVSPELVRVEFSFAKKYNYTLKWNENDLVLTLENFFTEEQVSSGKKSDSPSSAADEKQPTGVSSLSEPKEGGVEQETIDKHLPDMTDVLSSVAGAGTTGSEDKSGGKEDSKIGDTETISVDFYKIDLHNVFRMLREITGKNIVIAGGVSGNLTLALTDVPWQFALDIILNLKDLAKMERDNTIVIYPKDKEFFWPKQEDEGIDIKVDNDIIDDQKKKGITYTGERDLPPEQLEAKKVDSQR